MNSCLQSSDSQKNTAKETIDLVRVGSLLKTSSVGNSIILGVQGDERN